MRLNTLTDLKPLSVQRIRDLEASLYSAGRPLSNEDVKKIIGTRSDNVSNKMIRLICNKFKRRNCALEVVILEDGRVTMQLKPRYKREVQKYNEKPLLSRGPLKTLSYIAFHQPVLQKTVVDARGTHIYSHLKEMESMGLIHRERTEDRSFIITTTPYYGDYFGFSHHPERSRIQLKQIFNELKLTEMEKDENQFNGRVGGFTNLDELDEGPLADPRNRLSHGLSQYTGSSDNSSH